MTVKAPRGMPDVLPGEIGRWHAVEARAADADVLSLAVRLVQSLGLARFDVRLSSVGDEVCRPGYIAALREYYRPHLADLCDDCRRRFEIAPLRLLDCKNEHDRRIARQAP